MHARIRCKQHIQPYQKFLFALVNVRPHLIIHRSSMLHSVSNNTSSSSCVNSVGTISHVRKGFLNVKAEFRTTSGSERHPFRIGNLSVEHRQSLTPLCLFLCSRVEGVCGRRRQSSLRPNRWRQRQVSVRRLMCSINTPAPCCMLSVEAPVF